MKESFFFQQAEEIQLKNTVSGLHHCKGKWTKYIRLHFNQVIDCLYTTTITVK